MSFRVPNKYRVRVVPNAPHLNSTAENGNNGCFRIPSGIGRPFALWIVASDGEGWEHVSVSTTVRTPTWEEMCLVKDAFWDPEDVVVQYHPRRSEYINNHKRCLHLWRPQGLEIPTPPPILVGLRGVGENA